MVWSCLGDYSTHIIDFGRMAKGAGIIKYDMQVSSLENQVMNESS